MKLANFLFGIVIFSIVTTMMFAGVEDYLTQNRLRNPSEWEALAGDYDEFVGVVATEEESTARQIQEQTELGDATSETRDVTLLSGAISGGRLSFNFFTNFQNVTTKVYGDVGSNYIDFRVYQAIIALVIVFLVLVVLHFIRGFKTEV